MRWVFPNNQDLDNYRHPSAMEALQQIDQADVVWTNVGLSFDY